MDTIGQLERITQNRVVQLFKNKLGYSYLGNWKDRPNNSNIEEVLLRRFLKNKQKYNETLITKALYELNKVAGDQTRNLYDRNKAIYGLLRYGVKVKPDASENTETVWLIDWKNPLNNDFAIAEEVTIKGREYQAARRGDLCQRDRARRAGTEALDRLGQQWHSSESGQSG